MGEEWVAGYVHFFSLINLFFAKHDSECLKKTELFHVYVVPANQCEKRPTQNNKTEKCTAFSELVLLMHFLLPPVLLSEAQHHASVWFTFLFAYQGSQGWVEVIHICMHYEAEEFCRSTRVSHSVIRSLFMTIAPDIQPQLWLFARTLKPRRIVHAEDFSFDIW